MINNLEQLVHRLQRVYKLFFRYQPVFKRLGCLVAVKNLAASVGGNNNIKKEILICDAVFFLVKNDINDVAVPVQNIPLGIEDLGDLPSFFQEKDGKTSGKILPGAQGIPAGHEQFVVKTKNLVILKPFQFIRDKSSSVQFQIIDIHNDSAFYKAPARLCGQGLY